jgi:hypothetical protein
MLSKFLTTKIETHQLTDYIFHHCHHPPPQVGSKIPLSTVSCTHRLLSFLTLVGFLRVRADAESRKGTVNYG